MIRLSPMVLRNRVKRIKIISCLLIAVICLLYTTPVLAATLTGRVEVVGSYNIKPRKNLDEQIKAERSLVVSKDGGIKDAVVFIERVRGNPSLLKEVVPKEVVMNQKGKTFIPHVLPIIVGTKVTFKNSDPFVHRIISDSEAKKLRMEFAYEGATIDAIFDKPGIVELWCDDHKRMQAWILVMDTPFFATTDENGYFTITNLPPGKYPVKVWHEILGIQSQEIEVKEGENARVDFKLPGKEF